MDPLYYRSPGRSPYSFVANNPINNVDLNGLDIIYIYNFADGSGVEVIYPSDKVSALYVNGKLTSNIEITTEARRYDPEIDNPFGDLFSGGITGDNITSGSWPGQGYNLPGPGGSGKRRTGPKKKSKSSTVEKVAGAAGLANGTKSTILETTELVAKKAGEELGKAFSKYLTTLKLFNLLGYAYTGVEAVKSIKEDYDNGRPIDPWDVTDATAAGLGMLTIPFSSTAAVIIGGAATVYLGIRYLYDLYKGDH